MVFSYSKPVLLSGVWECMMFTATHSYIKLVVAPLFNTLEYGCVDFTITVLVHLLVSHIKAFHHSCYPCMVFWFYCVFVWKGRSELHVAAKMWALCRFIQWQRYSSPNNSFFSLGVFGFFFVCFFACSLVFYQLFHRTSCFNLLIMQWPALGQLLCEFRTVLTLWVAFVLHCLFGFHFCVPLIFQFHQSPVVFQPFFTWVFCLLPCVALLHLHFQQIFQCPGTDSWSSMFTSHHSPNL